MTDTLLTTIQQQLDRAAQPTSLRDLFAQTLNWGRAQGGGQQLRVAAPVSQTLVAQPVAQLGTIPLFRIDWPASSTPDVAQRRAVYHALAQVAVEHLVCYVAQGGRQLSFVWARDRGGKRVELRTLPYEQATPARTTLERLAALAFRFDEFDPFGGVAPTTVLERLNTAFDVELVTKQFFATYRRCFEQAEQLIQGFADANARRLFVQKLFNRLMFIVFLERKGWLRYGNRRDYLRALWEAHLHERLNDATATFYESRLKLLFFAGLSTPNEVNVVAIRRNHVLEERIGLVPYLNGGLFEEEADDRNGAILVPDAALEAALIDLFYRFNFTVSESTPFDIEVAVDPEMLGKVFEELVTGRHESGSYYTPRSIVAFMCREGLKGYLQRQLPHESTAAIASFVDDRAADELIDPEQMLAALKRVRTCDPACGSGAYLLGMLQELLALRTGLFAARRVDPIKAYQRKLEIIQNNIYGVDLDPFAVNIARLRLWLSLVVEYEGDDPPPLPNLDYKVEVGDSLSAPDPSGGLQPDMFRKQQIAELFDLKERYLRAHSGEKLALRAQVAAKEQEIAAWAHPKGGVQGFDWAVEFAEVFAEGGFDIVVANPPYVRQELIKAIKPILKSIYPNVYVGTADLYVYFYARALQSLRDGGMLCFITPNKWFRANYGTRLREYIAAATAIMSITDFGELPVFQAAATFPMIFVAQKASSQQGVTFTQVKDLEPPYPDVQELVQKLGETLPSNAVNGAGWTLGSTVTGRLVEKMKQNGILLEKYVDKQIYYGIKTGYNEAFVIDNETRSLLIQGDPGSADLIKPLAVGDDVRKWHIREKSRWLIVTPIGVDIKRYPAIFALLQQWQSALERRGDKGKFWWELRPCDYYDQFTLPKIVFPDLAKESRFTLDRTSFYPLNTCYIIPIDDPYLLGVLNSSHMWEYAKQHLSVLGDAEKGGRLRFIYQYVSQLPIPTAPVAEREAIATLAQHCLDASGQGPQVAAWEAEIDERVGRLYGLSAADLRALQREQG